MPRAGASMRLRLETAAPRLRFVMVVGCGGWRQPKQQRGVEVIRSSLLKAQDRGLVKFSSAECSVPTNDASLKDDSFISLGPAPSLGDNEMEPTSHSCRYRLFSRRPSAMTSSAT